MRAIVASLSRSDFRCVGKDPARERAKDDWTYAAYVDRGVTVSHRGWWQLDIKGRRSTMRIDSTLDGFGTLAERAVREARTRGIELSPTTIENLDPLGIELPDEWPPRDIRFDRFQKGDPAPEPPYLREPPSSFSTVRRKFSS